MNPGLSAAALPVLARLAGCPVPVPPERAAAPRDALDWSSLLATAETHGVVPSLWRGAVAAGRLAPLPPAVREHVVGPGGERPVAAVLEDAWDANRRRNDDLLDQLERIVAEARERGATAIPIKGSHLLLGGVWPDPAERTMADLDLLVEPGVARLLHDDLRRLGYRPVERSDGRVTKAWSHHLPALRDPGRFGAVELHLEPISIGWGEALPASELRRGAVDGGSEVPTSLPSATDAVTLALVHGWLADDHRFVGTVPLRATLDVVHLAARADRAEGSPGVDWERVRSRLARVGRSEVLDRHAVVAEAWLGTATPAARPSAATLRWFASLEGSRPPLRDRLAAVADSFDAGRLRRHYGPGRTSSLRVRHLAAQLPRPSRRP